jgi:hypothetical protein
MIRSWVALWTAALVAMLSLSIPSAAHAEACSNDASRVGPSASLPDCRAYELVTPPHTDGRLLESINTFSFGGNLWDLFPTALTSPDGDSFVFTTYTAPLLEPGGGAGISDVYQSQRGPDGWRTTRRLSPSGQESQEAWPIPGGISADHGYAFTLLRGYDSLVDPTGLVEITGIGREGVEPYAQGRFISPGGHHIIFTTGADAAQSVWCFRQAAECPVLKLEPNAPPTGTGAIYDRSADGPTQVVSLLPTNQPPAAGEQAFYKGASADGAKVAFAIGGTLYVRVDNWETLEVTKEAATFAGLSGDGRYLFYVLGGDRGVIHRFDTTSGADIEVNPASEGEIVNISVDGTHVYFISEEQLDGEGVAGSPNLFVWDGGVPTYITTVLESDKTRTSGALEGMPGLTNWTKGVIGPPENGGEPGPGANSSRTTPDGQVLVFESRAKITPYDSEGHTEIYRYDDQTKSVVCISCGTAPATGDARLQELTLIPPPIIVSNVTDDGTRVFFESSEQLVDADESSVNDVYEWQLGPNDEGRLALLSSGRSVHYPLPESVEAPYLPSPNILFGNSADGHDVFFLSQDALTPGAGEAGTAGIYDARVDGGFPRPPQAEACREEACWPASSGAHLEQFPALGTARGDGNVKPGKRRCRHRRQADKPKKHKICKGRHSRKRDATARRGPAVRAMLAGPARGGSLAADSQLLSPQSPASDPLSADGGLFVTSNAGDNFGIEIASADASTTAAAWHPDFTTHLELNHVFNSKSGRPEADARTEEVSVALPPGLMGYAAAIERCSIGQFVALGNCPIGSQVGVAKVSSENFGIVTEPIYNLAVPHPKNEVARFGFIGIFYPVFIDIEVRTASDYGVTATVHDSPGITALLGAETTLWGDPADSSHDELRLTPKEALNCSTACEAENGERPSTIPEAARKAFMTNPSACQSGEVRFGVRSYQLPGQLFAASAPLPAITDCTGLPFAPTFTAEPTSHVAGAPTGLKTKLVLPQHLGPDERATATMREARVTLPEGMQVAAGAANWIDTCSEAQVGFHQEVDADCPDGSKLGTATFISPAISTPIEGTIYQRAPRPGHQLGLWLTADALGLHIKLPGELEPDKTTGRLSAVFKDLPQVPVSEIELNVWGGDRAPLENPDSCGTYTTDFSFKPHSDDPAATGQSTMQITEGCNQGFNPALKAGVTNPIAGKYSPFVFDLTRPDGDQALRGFSLKLPDGELAKIKGVPLCSDADAAAATCPAASRIGSLQATTGPGPEPFTLPEPGKPQPQIYLSGPYQGAPFSIVSQVPAQAGPFDLGTLAVRSGLEVEPETGRAVVKADPLPQFFEGVGIAYRHLHAVVDRPEFNLNPTDCREMAVTADATSTQGAVAHPSARFQVDGCKVLKFKPKLSLKLKGGTERADYPALTATLKARKGDANVAFASVALPHSEFLAQEHIGTICTRKQFAADKCPKGSVYGKAKAITPLLDKPLAGPVYLRSSDHPLPDLVAKLGGQLEIHLVGRIDSVNGGIRTSFESVPDAPVTKFVLQMKGGRKGLLTNSTDICRGAHRATVQMKAQNGRAVQLRPELVASGCPKKKLGKQKKHR